MAINLKSMTRKELEKLRVDVDRELKRTIERDKKAAIAAAQKAAREHGFALSDITDEPKAPKPKKKAPKKPPAAAKYQHPEDPSATWTGKGRQPNWIKEAEAAGKSRDEFLIKK
jgi:DNA-binding protein H-NS